MNTTLYSLIFSALSFNILSTNSKEVCSLSCSSSEQQDLIRCLCVPKIIDCTNLPIDQNKCADESYSCQNQIMAKECPKKCYCDEPSILNKYCPICLNGGLRDFASNECNCKCFNGYQGSRCQYAKHPCEVNDHPTCSNIDCYNATEKDFFRCQRKCLCCKNKKCHNFGRINKDCTCDCIKLKGRSIFDSASDCANILDGSCVDDKICAIQYNVYRSNKTNCKFDFVRAMCPKLCGLC